MNGKTQETGCRGVKVAVIGDKVRDRDINSKILFIKSIFTLVCYTKKDIDRIQ